MRLIVDSAFTIALGPNAEFDIGIESGFKYWRAGVEYALDPAQPTALGPVLGMCGAEIDEAIANKSGELIVTFRGGSTIVVPPHPECEAWNCVGENGLRVVCIPDGGLAIWKPLDVVKPEK